MGLRNCKPKRPVFKALGFAQHPPARRVLSQPAVTAPQQVGVPGQRACLAYGAGRLVWETSPVLVTGARGGLGAACSREGVICAFSFTAGAVMGRSRSRRRCRSGWLWGFYRVAGLTIRGLAPVDAVVPSA